jgi:hypothetical protein
MEFKGVKYPKSSSEIQTYFRVAYCRLLRDFMGFQKHKGF